MGIGILNIIRSNDDSDFESSDNDLKLNYRLSTDVSTKSGLEIDYIEENDIIENGVYYFYDKNIKTSNILISYDDINIYVRYDNIYYKFIWDGFCYKDHNGSLISDKLPDDTYTIDDFLIIKRDTNKIKYNFPYNIYMAIKKMFRFFLGLSICS